MAISSGKVGKELGNDGAKHHHIVLHDGPQVFAISPAEIVRNTSWASSMKRSVMSWNFSFRMLFLMLLPILSMPRGRQTTSMVLTMLSRVKAELLHNLTKYCYIWYCFDQDKRTQKSNKYCHTVEYTNTHNSRTGKVFSETINKYM